MRELTDDKIQALIALEYNKKIALAEENFQAIMTQVDPQWKKGVAVEANSPAEAVKNSVAILASLIVFEDYCFSQKEVALLTQTLDLDAAAIKKLQYEAKDYFKDAMFTFEVRLDEVSKEKLAQIMILLATVDEHASKDEIRWIRKILQFIL